MSKKLFTVNKLKFMNFAFTLAETLIVIGIIGVVAALTLPNLNSSTGDKEKVVKLQKLYSNLVNAVERAQMTYGSIDKWCKDLSVETKSECNFKVGERITEYMKLSKNCKLEKNTGCFTDNTKPNGPEGTHEDDYSSKDDIYKFITADGASVYFDLNHRRCNLNFGISCPGMSCSFCGDIIVDIDGPNKGPYTVTKDIFYFQFDGDYGVVPQRNSNSAMDDDTFKNYCFELKDCTGWIIENGNMDYQKANSNGVCPNGTQLSRTVTSCN